MKIILSIFSIVLLSVITLSIFGGVISASLQDHSEMMMEGSCESNEECIFHQARTVFENNAVSTASQLQLAILVVSSFLLFVITKPNQKLHIQSYLLYWLKLLRFKDKWTSYLQRSIDKLKIQPVFSRIKTY
jgi:hypothetical protein